MMQHIKLNSLMLGVAEEVGVVSIQLVDLTMLLSKEVINNPIMAIFDPKVDIGENVRVIMV